MWGGLTIWQISMRKGSSRTLSTLLDCSTRMASSDGAMRWAHCLTTKALLSPRACPDRHSIGPAARAPVTTFVTLSCKLLLG